MMKNYEYKLSLWKFKKKKLFRTFSDPPEWNDYSEYEYRVVLDSTRSIKMWIHFTHALSHIEW